jgi:uncharacterized SAM-binding protein YcdF (DUF218 family)
MFVASKLLLFVTQPLAWVVLLLLAGLLLLRSGLRLANQQQLQQNQQSKTPSQAAWGLRFVGLALLVLLVQGWGILPDAGIRQLENTYPPQATPPDLKNFAGIVVLGGALDSATLWEGRTQPALNSAAERMVAPLPLMQQHPDLRLLFTGGEGGLWAQKLTEAQRADIFYRAMGLAPERLILEDRSRNTFENAVLSAAIAGVDIKKPWLLVTSAWHMPRSMATFEKAGWNVTPYPVDFRTGSSTSWTDYSLSDGASRWQLLLHEWLGLWVYQFTGRA